MTRKKALVLGAALASRALVLAAPAATPAPAPAPAKAAPAKPAAAATKPSPAKVAPAKAAAPAEENTIDWVETPRSKIKQVWHAGMLLTQQAWPKPDAHIDARDGTLDKPGLKFLRWNEQGYEEYQWIKDRSTMILVPAGAFRQGLATGEWYEHPVRKVESFSAYLIDKYEVTIEQYARFLSGYEYRMPRDWENMQDDQYVPVTNISWFDANQYAEWAGKRLPTEAEWERAALGVDNRLYPWGAAAPTQEHANFDPAGVRRVADWKRFLQRRAALPLGTSPVGAMAMAGNVFEWCQDWYADTSYQVTPPKDPQGPTSGEERCMRGGSVFSTTPDQLLGARRSHDEPRLAKIGYGFRTAIPVSAIDEAVKRVVSPGEGLGIESRGPDVPIQITKDPEAPEPPVKRPLDAPDVKGFQYIRKNTQGAYEYQFKRDRFDMVLVPGGSFDMGSPDELDRCERPVHKVALTSYLLAKYETTVFQYGKFLLATNHPKPDNWARQWKVPDAAVAWVSHDDASEYAKWCGMRLPTEAEWEYAARGTDGRVYPWGNDPATDALCVCGKPWTGGADEAGAGVYGRFQKGASPFGIYDMAGNLWEWVEDWFGCRYDVSDGSDPEGRVVGRRRVARGGSWREDCGNFQKATTRNSFGPEEKLNHVGFRVAMDVPKRVGAFR